MTTSPRPAGALRGMGALGASVGAVVVAVGLDRVLGEGPLRPHPVAVFGRVMGLVERVGYADSRRAGLRHAVIGAGLGALAGRRLGGTGRGQGGPGRRALGVAAATYIALGGRGLADAADSVGEALDRGDLGLARQRLPALVGRDPAGLDEAAIARAVVESVAENTVDAIVAPVLAGLVGGASGVLAYRAVNTLDAMVGHRSARYERFGWASARADDAVNWVPARLAAALVAAVRPGSAATVWRTVRHDARAHPSPNSGVVEAAFAAALGLRLGGVNHYGGRPETRPTLGTGRLPAPGDIARAKDLSRDVTAALVAVLVLFASLAGIAGRARRRGGSDPSGGRRR